MLFFKNNKNTLQQDILLGHNEIRNLTLLLILLQVNFFKLERKKKINFGFEKMKEPLDTHETPAGTYASFITVSAGAAVLSPGSHWLSGLLDMSNGKGCTEPNRYHSWRSMSEQWVKKGL